MTTTIPAEISAFAAQVRTALADLPADELEELTEGLEADLSEAYAEDLARELPDPAAYAAELRAAAGLPEPEARRAGVRGGVASLRQAVGESVRDVGVAVRRHPAGRALLDLADSLRPVWWVLRAWVATYLAAGLLGGEAGFAPSTASWWLVLAVAVTVSVQWGRGAWGAGRLRPVVVVGNVVAVVALPVVVAAAHEWESYTYDQAYLSSGYAESPDLTGLYLDGTQVTNVFVYDAKGRPLRDVQLFTSEGQPLFTSVPGGSGCTDPACTSTSFWSPGVLDGGQVAWNVFPLRMLQADEGLGVQPGAQPRPAPLPFEEAPAVDREASGRTSALASVLTAAGVSVPQAVPTPGPTPGATP